MVSSYNILPSEDCFDASDLSDSHCVVATMVATQVDRENDRLIQGTIRENSIDIAIFSIARRLGTHDFDRISIVYVCYDS